MLHPVRALPAKSQPSHPSHDEELRRALRISAPPTGVPIRMARQSLGYDNLALEEKRRAALKVLGTWHKSHPQTTYIDRGEHYLTIYHRMVTTKRPTVSLVTGTTMLGGELKDLIANFDDKVRFYVGDLKLLGESDEKPNPVK